MPLIFWLDVMALSFSTVVALALALMVLGADFRNKLTRCFAALMLLEAVWGGTSALYRLDLWLERGDPLLLSEISALALALMGPVLLLLTVHYMELRSPLPARLVGLGFVLIGLSAVPLFQHGLITDPAIQTNGSTTVQVSALGIGFALLPLFFFSGSFALFWRARKHITDPFIPLSLLILLAGFIFGGLLAVPFPVLSLATTLSVFLLGYSVVSRQLFNPLKQQTVTLQHEIAERIRITEALQASEARLQAVLDSSTSLIFLIDPDYRYLLVNRAYETVLNKPREAILGRRMSDVWPEEVAAHFLPNDQAVFETRQPVQSEETVVLDDGPHTFLSVKFPLLTASGDIYAMGGILTDLTQYRRAAEAALQTRQQFQDMFDNTPAAVYAKDLDGRFMFANRVFYERTGLSNEIVIGKTRHELLPHLDAIFPNLWEEHEQQVLQSGQSMTFEEVGQTTGRTYLATKFLLYDANEKPYALCNSSLDITKRVQAEREREQYTERLHILRQIDQAILAAESPEAIAEAVLHHIRALTACERASVVTFDVETNRATILCAQNNSTTQLGKNTSFSLESYGVAAELWRGEMHIVNDIPAESLTVPVIQALWDEGIRSYANIPLMFKGELIGALNFGAETPRTFKCEHLEMIREVADQLAIAIQQAHLSRDQREQRALAEALRDSSAAMTSTLEFDDVLERILSNVQRVVPHDAANIMLIENGVARVARGRGYEAYGEAEWIEALRYVVAETPIWHTMLETSQPFAIPDTWQEPKWPRIPQEEWIRSTVKAPICIEGQSVGILHLDSATPGTFTQEHANRLQVFADQAAIAIRNAWLFKGEQQRRQIAETLFQAAAVLNSTLNLNQVLDLILQQLRAVLTFDSASIQQVQDDKLVIIACQGFENPGVVIGLAFPIEPKFPNMRVITERAPMIFDDIGALYPHFRSEADIYMSGNIRSWMGLPMLVKDRLIGMITVDRTIVNPFTDDDIQLATAFAHQAATAIENAQLYEQIRRRVDDLSAVYTVSHQLQQLYAADELAQQIILVLQHVLGYENCSVLLIEQEIDRLVPFASSHPMDSWPLNQGITGWVARTGQPIRIQDVESDSRYYPDLPGMRSEMCVPMLRGDHVIGVINVESPLLNAYTESEQLVLETVATQITVAIESTRLFEAVQRHAEELEQRVTERTAELQRTTERVQTILNSSPDAIILLGEHRTIQVGNPAFNELFGYQPDEAFGQKAVELFHARSRVTFGKRLHMVLTQGHPSRFEVVAQRNNEYTFDADVALAPIRDEGGITGAVCSIRDISALKEVERLKDAFVSNVTHELRTPLTNLKLRHHLLAKQPTRLQDHLDVIQRETERLANIIEDLLRLSRMDQGRMELNIGSVDLAGLARQYTQDRTPMAEDKGIRLSIAETAPLPAIEADEGLLGQALSILLTNALNYTPSDGTVTVTTLTKPGDGIDWIGIRVADTGPGIPPDEQTRLFERFFRGTAAYESGAPGTGLGLAILKEIVDRHGGKVEVESMPGQGAAFTIWLPQLR